MIHQSCCIIWRSSWHFNSLFQWIYSQIKYSYHTYTLSFQLKRLPQRDLVCCIVVCQTDAYPSAKLLPRTAETGGRLSMKTEWQIDRPPILRNPSIRY